nr:E3 ubiquitin-protein ligase COP1-like [Tanacetum cinerariifolium]
MLIKEILMVKELDVLLVLLADKKRKMKHEEAETNLQIMRDFLLCLRKPKLEELNEVLLDLLWSPRVTLGRLLPHARGLGFKPRRGGFPSGAKNEWGLSPKTKVRVLHTAQLNVTSKLERPLRKRLQQSFIQRQVKREKENQIGNCIKQITLDCKDMLRRKLEEIELYNSTINQNKHKIHKCFKCKQRGHILRICPMNGKSKDKEAKTDTSEIAKETKEVIKPTKPSVILKYLECIHFSTKCMIKEFGMTYDLVEKQGFEITYKNNRCSFVYMFNNTKNHKIDEGRMRTMQNQYLEDYFESLAKKDASIEEDLIQIKGRSYLTKVSTFNEYVAFLNLIKQHEVVSQEWDRQEFGTIGEILGLSKQDGEEVKRCYINYLDVFTSYYKTARVPQQEYNCILNDPTKKVEEDIERICPMSHQWDFDETCAPLKTNAQEGKGKLEHFGVKLEDTEDAEDIQPQPIQSHYTRNLQGMITGPSTSRKSDKRQRIELYRARATCSVKLRMLFDDPSVRSSWPSLMDKRNTRNMSIGNTIQGQFRLGTAAGSQSRTADKPAPVISQEVQRKDACSGSDSQNTQPGVSVARKRRVYAHVSALFLYGSRVGPRGGRGGRRPRASTTWEASSVLIRISMTCKSVACKSTYRARQAHKQEERDCTPVQREGYHPGLKDFQSVLSSFTRYRFIVYGYVVILISISSSVTTFAC